MSRNHHTEQLPQLAGGVYLTDAGIDVNCHTPDQWQAMSKKTANSATRKCCEKLNSYYRELLELACETGTGFILDTPVCYTQPSEPSSAAMASINDSVKQAVDFVARLRADYRSNEGPIVLNGSVGSLLKTHNLQQSLDATKAAEYYSLLIRSLAVAGVDMITANTLSCSHDAIDIASVAKAVDIPLVISFAVKHNGRLPSEETLLSAIDRVDAATGQQPIYYMVDCADPDHFLRAHSNDIELQRIKGISCGAHTKRCDASTGTITQVDDHASQIMDSYRDISNQMPWITVFGRCGSNDLIQLHPIATMLCAIRRHDYSEVYQHVKN